MMINFICGVIAELFDSPCNFSPIDEYMFRDNFCESHCGEVADKDCWKRYFEKRWKDSKMSEIPTSSEKPNNCEVKNYCDDCLYNDVCDNKEFFYACTSKATISKMEQVDKDTNVRSKEPQTDGYMTAEQTEDYHKMLDKAEHRVYGNIEDEPQTDCAWGKSDDC